MRGAAGVALVVVIWCCAAPAAQAAPRCARSGERVVARTTQLVMLTPSPGVVPGDTRIVCRRDSGRRRTLVRTGASCSKCYSTIEGEALRGRFAHVVVSSRSFNDQRSELVTLDTRTWRVRGASLALGDQGSFTRSDVLELVAAPHGRAILRVRNDFAAGIVLAGAKGAAYLDEGLAEDISAPHLRGSLVSWRHRLRPRRSPAILEDRCPPPPTPEPPDGTDPGQGQILGSADAVTSDRWFCIRPTGKVGQLDGAVVRLLGVLAVVRRPVDTRVVDLRSGATVSGPIAVDERYRATPTVGRSGTLVLYRPVAGTGDQEVVAASPGMPERQIARGRDLLEVRYQDGLVRYSFNNPFKQVLEGLP